MLALQQTLSRNQANWEQRALSPFPVTQQIEELKAGVYRNGRQLETFSLRFPQSIAGQAPRVSAGGVDLTYLAHGTHPHKPSKRIDVGRQLVISELPPRYTGYEGLKLKLSAPVVAAGAGAPTTESQAMYEHVRALLPGLGIAGGAPIAVQHAMRQAAEAKVNIDVYALRAAVAYVAAVWAAQEGGDLIVLPGVGVTSGGVLTIEEYRAVWGVAATSQHVGVMMCSTGGADASRTADIFTTIMSDTCVLATGGLEVPGVVRSPPPTGFDLLLALGATPGNRAELRLTPSELWAFGCDLCGQYGHVGRFISMVSAVSLLIWSSDAAVSPVFQAHSWTMPCPVGRGSASLLLPGSVEVDRWLAGFPQPPQPNKKDLLASGAAASQVLGCAVREAFIGLGGWFVMDQDVIHGTAALDACRTAGGANELMSLAESVLNQLNVEGVFGPLLCGIAPVLRPNDAVPWLSDPDCYQWEEAALLLVTLPPRSVLIGGMQPMLLQSQTIRTHWVDPMAAVAGDRGRVAKAAALVARGARLGMSVMHYAAGTQEVTEFTLDRVVSYRGIVSDWVLMDTRVSGLSRIMPVVRIDSVDTVLRCGMAASGTIARTWYIDRPARADEFVDLTLDARGPPPEIPAPKDLQQYAEGQTQDPHGRPLKAEDFTLLRGPEGGPQAPYVFRQPRFTGFGASGTRGGEGSQPSQAKRGGQSAEGEPGVLDQTQPPTDDGGLVDGQKAAALLHRLLKPPASGEALEASSSSNEWTGGRRGSAPHLDSHGGFAYTDPPSRADNALWGSGTAGEGGGGAALHPPPGMGSKPLGLVTLAATAQRFQPKPPTAPRPIPPPTDRQETHTGGGLHVPGWMTEADSGGSISEKVQGVGPLGDAGSDPGTEAVEEL